MTEILPDTWLCSFCPETSYLATVQEPGRGSVEVLDLNTYPEELVFPPTRMPDSSGIKDVILLPSFVVVVTWENHGYSWNLKTHRVYQFEVPDLYYQSDRIHGNGTLIAIASQDSVIVHDVQAEKESSFKDIGNDTRTLEGIEPIYERTTFTIASSEKRVVWLFRELQCPIFYDRIFAVDILHLETGEVALGEVRSLPDDPPSCEDGPSRRIVFDTRTGVWTEEAYTIIFPACVTEFTNGDVYSRLIIRSDDFGHLVFGSHERVRMLGQEPGDHATRAGPLSPAALARYPIEVNYPFSCLGFCDKFLVGINGTGTGTGTRAVTRMGFKTGTVVIRFKGIHDCVG